MGTRRTQAEIELLVAAAKGSPALRTLHHFFYAAKRNDRNNKENGKEPHSLFLRRSCPHACNGHSKKPQPLSPNPKRSSGSRK